MFDQIFLNLFQPTVREDDMEKINESQKINRRADSTVAHVKLMVTRWLKDKQAINFLSESDST